MKHQFIIRYAVFMLLAVLGTVTLLAQQKTITGKIIDQATGQPLQGATINVKGSLQSVTVNATGNYSITVPSPDAVLVISYVGYGTQEITVGKQSVINVSLSNSTANLNEVVVVGYGQVKKRDLTGSVVSIKGDETTKIPVNSPIEALQGKIAGADIYRDNGYAGGGSNIRLRGTRSIANPGSSNNVLYIIDGIQGMSMSDINPNDIQSIDVLKDASSTSIYGSRGANGVIIITTKRGSSGKAKLSFNSYVGQSQVAKVGKMRSGPEYIDFKREAYRADGLWSSPADDSKIFNDLEMEAINNKLYIDWADLMLRKGTQQDYQLGVSGGSDKTKVYFSAGYFREKGILRLNDFKRYSARFNIDQTINSWITAGISSQYAYIDNDIRRDPFNFGYKAVPLGRPYDEFGNVVLKPAGGTQFSPLLDEQPGEWYSNAKTSRFSGAAFVQLNPFKGLDFRSTFSSTTEGTQTGTFYGKNSINGGGANSQASINDFSNQFFSWENQLTYRKTINDHSITLTGVTSYLQNRAVTHYTQGRNQLFSSQLFYNLASANQQASYSSKFERWNLLSYTGRINYSYKGKYLLTLTGRRDGSSKLGEGNKWAFFPSAAVAWRMIDENFMDKQDLFDDLKLRVSYGVSGNDVINPYSTQYGLTQIQFAYGDNLATAYGISPTIGNPDLKWELTATTDIGVDFSILRNRVSGSIDYYDAKTYNLIFPYTLPSSTGVSTINRNVGKTNNRGIEISITSNNISTSAFKWVSTVTFARNRERITQLPNGNVIQADYRTSLILGESPTILYDYVKLGIWQLGEEAEAAKYESKPGDIKIADLSGPEGKPDGKITSDDRTIIGTRVPKWTGGINNDFSYKNFSLNVLLIARIGQWMTSDYYAKYYRNASQNGSSLEYWTPENPVNTYPRPSVSGSTNFLTTLTEYENSYIKLRNITLGYDVPKNISSKAKIDNLRFYVSGKNLIFFSKNNKRNDPEAEGQVDKPLNRLWVAGVNVTF